MHHPTFLPLILFALLFVGGHLTLSALPVRDHLVATLGGRRFIPLYSLMATVSLAGMIWSYGRAPVVVLWQAPAAAAWVPVLVMPFALWLLVESLSRKNPTSVSPDGHPEVTPPQGLFVITRHPGMWGFALWAASHLVVNGDVASVILMGAVLLLALVGTCHMDGRRRAKLGTRWHDYSRQTSWLPFAALIQGRARLHPSQLGWKRPLAAALLYGALLYLHPLVLGVSPLP